MVDFFWGYEFGCCCGDVWVCCFVFFVCGIDVDDWDDLGIGCEVFFDFVFVVYVGVLFVN